MKYPRLNPKLDRRRKLMPWQILLIRRLKNIGLSTIYLAKAFNVSKTLILYYTNEEVRKKVLDRARHLRSTKETQKESIVYIHKVNPKIKDYQRYINKKRSYIK